MGKTTTSVSCAAGLASRESDLQAHHQRGAIIDDLLAQHKRKIERLTKAFGDEEDELIGASLQQEIRATKRAYDALQLEKERLESQITQ